MHTLKRAVMILALFIPLLTLNTDTMMRGLFGERTATLFPLPFGERAGVRCYNSPLIKGDSRGLLGVRVLASLFSIQPAEAYTYQDVENALNSYKAQYPNDKIWIEKFEQDGKKGYKIWKRPKGIPFRKMYYVAANLVKTGPYGGGGFLSFMNCDGTLNFYTETVVDGAYYTMGYPADWRAYYAEVTDCDGVVTINSSDTGAGMVSARVLVSPCWIGTVNYNNCTTSDVLLATFFPIDECDVQVSKPTGNTTVIDPDAGGSVRIEASISSSSSVTWEMTVAGMKIAEGSGLTASGIWDGKLPDGRIADEGTYTVTLTASSATVQNCTKTETATITITRREKDCKLEVTFGSKANVASGNLYHSQTLFQTQSSKLGSDFTLSYNSLDPYTGPLGLGWTHSYNIHLTPTNDGRYVLMEGDGERIVLIDKGNGTYTPENSTYPILTINTDGTYLLTKKDGTKYHFDTTGKLTKIEDRLANTMSFIYTGSNLTEITDSVGRRTTLSYDSNNRIISITGYNSTLTLTYDLSGYLTAVTDSAGYSWTYTYDENGRMLTKSDTEGNVVTYTYDSEGRVISSTDSSGNTKTISYTSPAGGEGGVRGETTFTETNGGTWTYTYDSANGTLTQKKDPQGNTITYQYDNSRNLIKETAPDGSATAYTYDTSGNMTSQADASGNTTTYAYNDYGQVTSITDSQNDVINYSYDTYGNLTSVTDLSGGITQFNYDSKGNITRITSPNGGVTVYEYDQYNNITKITDPTGATTSFTYDTSGNMTSITDSSGNTTRFEYNSLNQLIRVTDPNGNITEYSYDSKGNKTSQTDANGNTTFYEYNHNSKLTKVTDVLGNATNYTYGGTGGCQSCGSGGGDNLTSITDANGNITTYQYDTLGRLTKETDPLGNEITYSYDTKGNLTQKTDANGTTINYTYDTLGRLLKKKYPDNTEETFTYDSKGNILTATNQNISYTFTYDASGKPLSVTDSYGRTIKYEYDVSGNKTNMTASDVVRSFSFANNYTYDISRRLTQIQASSPLWGEGGGEGFFSFTYDTAGRRTKLTYPNGVTTNYTYDSIGRLTNLLTQYAELKEQGKKKPPILKLQTIDSFTYTHDKVGNRLSKTETDKRYDYSYDIIYRLLQSTPTKLNSKEKEVAAGFSLRKEETFTYDPVGNRLTGPEDKLNYTYNQGNQLTQTQKSSSPLAGEGKGEGDSSIPIPLFFKEGLGEISYTYDNNGNLTKKVELDDDGNIKKTILYSYDYENRLIKVENSENCSLITGHCSLTTVSFTYDPFGRRLSKSVHRHEIDDDEDERDDEDKHTPRTTYYVYDNEDIIMEYNHKGKVRARYVHGAGIDEPLAVEQKGKAYYYHLDGLGSVTAITDAKGKVVQRYEYDSFGKLKRHGNKVKNAYTYTSREYDRETGLYYYRARYYDAKVGRFISFDPILKGINHTETATCRKSISSFPLQQPQKLHPYVYTGNAPITFVDPWGECPATINTGWMYTTEGPNRATDYRYQSQYKERTIGTLIKQSGKCENRCGGTIDCTYIFAESYYARKRDYDRGTQTYGSWGGWRGYENENIGTGILRYSCEQQRFIGGSNFNN